MSILYLIMDFSIIKLSWRQDARPLEPKLMVNPRHMELETAKDPGKDSNYFTGIY
jgi:hypothetical protein